MKALIVLIVLLALPFSVKIKAEDSLKVWIADVGHLSVPDIDSFLTPTFEVYYVDTVGWKLTFDNRIVTLLENEGAVPVVDSIWYRLYGEPLLEPVTKTVIVARFRADVETTKIRKWRVREK